MSYNLSGNIYSAPAGADLRTHRFRAMSIDSAGKVVRQTTLGGPSIGPLMEVGNTDEVVGVDVGSVVCEYEAGGTVTAGLSQKVLTDGRISNAAATVVATADVNGSHIVGIALRSGTAGQVIPVLRPLAGNIRATTGI